MRPGASRRRGTNAGVGVDADELLRWLATDDARAAAAHEVRRLRLPDAVADDLLQNTARRLLVTAARGLPDDLDATAYARRALAHAAVDLFRQDRRRRRTESDVDFDGYAGPLPTPSAEAPAQLAVLSDLEDGCRRAVHALLAPRPWAGAAALTVLTLGCHPGVPVPLGTPLPGGGTPDQDARWAALWLAGLRACFPDGDGAEDAATRQRRSRALRQVDDLLRRAAALAGVGSGR